ncbi:LOW QUALITY PROTEIN: EF-hand calcium-binding domain-containing protein 6 [Alca torda]
MATASRQREDLEAASNGCRYRRAPRTPPRAAGNDPRIGSLEPAADQCGDVAGSGGRQPGRDGGVAPPQRGAGPGTAAGPRAPPHPPPPPPPGTGLFACSGDRGQGLCWHRGSLRVEGKLPLSFAPCQGETMAKVTTAEDLRALEPSSQGIIFTPGPHSTQNRVSLCSSRQCSIKSAAAMPVRSAPDPTLYSWDIGQILLQKIAEKEDEMKKAFQMLGVGQMLTVTKGEFRRAIETFLFHLTEAEFYAGLAEVEHPQSPNNDIKSAGNPAQGGNCKGCGKNIIRCCRLFDYSHAGWIQGHILRQILEIICFRMKDSEFENDTEKAFRAIGVSQSEFVSLDYLKSVINGFIFPLPNETFQELMNRFGLKATGKITWQQFLEKFQDPGATFENRQRIPMRKKKKVNPARAEAFFSDTVLQKLHRYIQDAYSSLKQAFLMLDEKQDGKITRNDLRRVLHNLVFQVKDKDFQELIEIIDPEQTGYLDYHEILDLFEEKESVVEEILSDAITENWKDFHKALQSCDPKCTGTVKRSHLRKVLQLCCSSLSDQQFMKLSQEKVVDYAEKQWMALFIRCSKVTLLDNLKGAILSGDLNAISSHISKEKQQREEKRQTELSKRIKQMIEDQANKYAQNKTVDKVIKRLKDRVIQQTATTKGSFFAYNKAGKINKAGLQKQVLEDHGMAMDLLTEKLGLPDGGLSFLDFVAILEDARLNGPGATLCNSPNQGVNGAKYHYMTAEECLNNDKLMEVYGDTYSAFRETDSNHDGTTNMLDFRQFLHSFLLRLRDEEFLRLFVLLGMNLASTLNYQEFCQLFHTQETKEVCPRVVPSHKKKQLITDAELACDHAHYYLVIKARTRWHDLARNFQKFDSEGNGIIQPRDLKKVLFRFGIPITPEEFKQLWARYDTDEKGYLTHQEFLHKLGIEFASAEKGLSKHITDNSYAHLQMHYNNQQKKHSKLEEQQKQQTKALHVRKIKKQIKDKFRDYFQDFNKAFHKVDKNRDGCVTVCDLHRILEFNYYIDHDQFSSLPNSLGISIHDSKLSYFDFLRAIDDGRASKYQQRQKQAAPPASFAALSLEQTLIKIKEIVASSYDLLYKTEEGQKVIPPKSSLELSDRGIPSQVQEVVTAGFNTTAQEPLKDMPTYIYMKMPQESLPIWVPGLPLLIQTPAVLAVVSAQSCYRSVTSSHSLDDFTENVFFYPFLDDGHLLFAISKAQLESFKNLWNTVDFSAGGRLKYDDYLKKFSSEVVTMPSSTPSATGSATSANPAAHTMQDPRVSSQPERPKTSSSLILASSRPQTTTCSAPILNCETTENKIRKNIQHSWRGILKVCDEKDVKNLGEIPVPDFQVKKNGRFACYDFLQSCILLLKPQKSSLLQRVIIQKPQKPLSPGPQTISFFSAMLRIQPQILHCWTPMKRTSKSYDESHTRLLRIAHFRQVLHEYGINLTEEELFSILEYCDKNLSSKISYNDFLWAFIQ